MDPQNNKFANVNMKYSDKAKKVFYNIKLGKSPDREEKTDKIIQSFNEEGILAEPITDGDGKAVPGAIRVIFSLLVNDRNDNNGYFTWNDFLGNNEEGITTDDFLDELFSMVEDYGYNIDKSEKRLVASTPQVVESTRKALKNATSSNVSNMINDFFANLHDPKVQRLLNSIQVVTDSVGSQGPNDIGNVGVGTAKAILASQALSTKNTIWIISQWLSYNRQDKPTMIATANQWANVGRLVNNYDYPLVASMPYRYNGDEMGEAGASAKFGGVTRSDAFRMDRGVGRAFDRQASFQSFGDGNFTKVVYYDISDTDIFDPYLWQSFASDANMENMSHEFNQKALDLMSDDERDSIGNAQNGNVQSQEGDSQDGETIDIQDNAVNIKLTLEAISELVGGNKLYSDTMMLIKSNPNAIDKILRSYYSHHDNIDREKDVQKQKAMLDICVGVTEIELHIGLVDMASKWNKVSHFFKTPNELVQMSNNTAGLINAVKNKQSEYVMSENRLLMESSDFTFDDFLNDLGITRQELIQQCKSNSQNVGEMTVEGKSIKNAFGSLWNRIIDANNKNHGVI